MSRKWFAPVVAASIAVAGVMAVGVERGDAATRGIVGEVRSLARRLPANSTFKIIAMSAPVPDDAIALELPWATNDVGPSGDPVTVAFTKGPVAHLSSDGLELFSTVNDASRRESACTMARRMLVVWANPRAVRKCSGTEASAQAYTRAEIPRYRPPSAPQADWDELWRSLDGAVGIERIRVNDLTLTLTSFEQIESSMVSTNTLPEMRARAHDALITEGWVESPAPHVVAFTAKGAVGVTAVCVYASETEARKAATTVVRVASKASDLYQRIPFKELLGHVTSRVDGRVVAFTMPNYPFADLRSWPLQQRLPMFVVREAERKRIAGN